MKFYAIIPAAGSGDRFGGKKQFQEIAGVSLLERTIRVFKKSGLFEKIVFCLSPDEIKKWPDRREEGIHPVAGGKSRAESVYHGFCFLKSASEDIILVHDAVRPLVSVDLIRKVAERTVEKGAVVPVLPVTDTLKEIIGDKILRTLDRNKVFFAQTPQGFRSEHLAKAYEKALNQDARWTDEAGLLEACGIPVMMVLGEVENIKVTTKFDLKLAEGLLCE